MDIEKAIKAMENIKEYWAYKPTEVEAAELAIQALEKQIPKKPINEGKTFTKHWLCPTCNRIYWERGYLDNYCSSCGQRIV